MRLYSSLLILPWLLSPLRAAMAWRSSGSSHANLISNLKGIHMHTHTHTHTHSHIHSHTYTCTHAHMHSHSYTHVHTHTHTHTRTHTQTHMHAHTHTVYMSPCGGLVVYLQHRVQSHSIVRWLIMGNRWKWGCLYCGRCTPCVALLKICSKYTAVYHLRYQQY